MELMPAQRPAVPLLIALAIAQHHHWLVLPAHLPLVPVRVN